MRNPRQRTGRFETERRPTSGRGIRRPRYPLLQDVEELDELVGNLFCPVLTAQDREAGGLRRPLCRCRFRLRRSSGMVGVVTAVMEKVWIMGEAGRS